MMSTLAKLLGLLAFGLAAGCGGGDDDGNGGTKPDTFAAIHSEIIVPKCNGPLCHLSAAGGNLVMSSMDAAYDALINQPAAGTECASSNLKRVVPGDPQNSLLYLKITTPPCGDAMPNTGAPLAADQIERIRAWIAAGAIKE